jgi:hypothetical protein
MLREYANGVKTIDVSPDEYASLLAARRDALDNATKLQPDSKPLPAQWRMGWQAKLEVLGRDRDGSLLARIRVNSPERKDVYRRHVRLVRTQPRPSERMLRLTQR